MIDLEHMFADEFVLQDKQAVTDIMQLARVFRHAPADLYDMAYRNLEQAVYVLLQPR